MQELLALTSGQPEVALAAGEVLLHQGDEPHDFFVLVSGRLMVRRGDEDFIAIEAPGACIGEMAVLMGRTHTATVVVTHDCRLRVIADARETLREDPPLLHAVASLLAKRLDLVNQYLADLQSQYRDIDGGLGLVGDVVRELATDPGDDFEPGSEREPHPLY